MILVMDYSNLQTQIWMLLLLLTVDKNDGADLPVTVTGDRLTGTSISLTCSIPSFTQLAEWKNSKLGAGAIQSCTRVFCIPTNPTYPGYTFTSNTTDFTITIANATLNDDIWTCEHDTAADTSGPQTLNLKVAPATCTLVESGGTYTCTSSCGYPANDMSIRAKLNGTANTQELTSLTAVSAPACTSPESAYSANVPTSFFTQSADLYCECGVNGIESTFIQSNAVAVTARSSTSDSDTTTIALAVIGLIAAVVCVALCWFMYFQFCGKFQGPCSGFIKSKFSVNQTLIAAIVIAVLCVTGIILCIVALATKGFELAVAGFALAVGMLVIVIILVILVRCGILTKKDGGNTTTRDQPDGQEGRRPHIDSQPGTESSPRSARSPTSASNIKTKWKNNQVSDSNESDGSNGTPRRRLEDVPQGRKLPALELSGASQKANTLEPIEFNETKKLKKKKKRRSKEEKAQDDGEN